MHTLSPTTTRYLQEKENYTSKWIGYIQPQIHVLVKIYVHPLMTRIMVMNFGFDDGLLVFLQILEALYNYPKYTKRKRKRKEKITPVHGTRITVSPLSRCLTRRTVL